MRLNVIARLAAIATLLICTVRCSNNFLEMFANTQTNDALYEDAQKKVDQGDYSGALDDLSHLKDPYASTEPVIFLKATAYAGRCGLNAFTFADSVKNLGSQRLFPFLLKSFPTTVGTHIDDCVSAQGLIESLGTVSTRTSDENLMLALIEFAKLGAILSYYADVGQTGSVTAAYNPCTAGGPPRPVAGGSISDADAAEFGAGMALLLENVAAVAAQLGGASDSLGDITTLCGDLGGLGASYNFCSETDASNFSANEILAVRSLILEGSAVGLQAGSCPSGGDITNSACRCF